jgi:hypothetical protein
MTKLITACVALLVSGGVALAQPTPEQEKKAEEYFLKGDTAYNLGRYDEAVENFTKAYESWPQPEFLYNIAQSYRQAGNCKQALHFYKRFKSLKEKDTANPLSKKKREEVERFIAELTECAAKADTSAETKPDTIDKPGKDRDPDTNPDTDPDDDRIAVLPKKGDDDDDDLLLEEETPGPKLLSARFGAGVAIFNAGDLAVPAQPSFGLVAGYPIAAGPMIIDVGAGLSYSPLPYETEPMRTQETGSLLGVRAVVAGTYLVNPKIGLRGDLGVGIVSLGGLVQGNPWVTDRTAQSFTMLNVRFGVAADYAITPNVIATLSPFNFGYSPGADGMFAESISEIDILLGIGYRM